MSLILTLDLGKTLTVGRTHIRLDRIIQGRTARLCIDAPPEVAILRSDAVRKSPPTSSTAPPPPPPSPENITTKDPSPTGFGGRRNR